MAVGQGAVGGDLPTIVDTCDKSQLDTCIGWDERVQVDHLAIAVQELVGTDSSHIRPADHLVVIVHGRWKCGRAAAESAQVGHHTVVIKESVLSEVACRA